MARTPKPENFEPVPKFPKGHRHSGRPRCQAWNMNAGRQCLGLAMGGGDKCRVHGGAASQKNRGISNPNFKHGKYSKHLPKRLIPLYDEMAFQTNYLSMQEEISTLDALIAETLSQMDEEAGAGIFKQLKTEMKGFDDANAMANRMADDETGRRRYLAMAANHLQNIRQLITAGNHAWSMKHEFMGMVDQRKRLVDTDRKTLMDAKLLLSVEFVIARFDALMTAVEANIRDKGVIDAIQTTYNDIIQA